MANDSAKVITGKPLVTGGALVAPIGTAAPTNVATALNVAFKPLGYISEDGVTENSDRSTDRIRAWGGDTVKTVQSDYSATFAFTMIEAFNADVLKQVYGENKVTVTPATESAGTLTSVVGDSEQLPVRAYVFEIKDGDKRIRIYIPRGQITVVDEITYNDTDVVGYSVTVETYKDAAIGGYFVKIHDDGVFDES